MNRTIFIPNKNGAPSDWITATTGPLNSANSGHNFAVAANYMCNLNGMHYRSMCAMAGNISAESGWNPWRFEDDDIGDFGQGVGLVQWTPGTKMTEWCEQQFGSSDSWKNGYNQLSRIIYEKNNGLQWIPTNRFPFSFESFWVIPATAEIRYWFPLDWKNIQSTDDIVYLLGLAWCYNYERPQVADQPGRGHSAVYWFHNGGNFGYNPRPFKLLFKKRKHQYKQKIRR